MAALDQNTVSGPNLAAWDAEAYVTDYASIACHTGDGRGDAAAESRGGLNGGARHRCADRRAGGRPADIQLSHQAVTQRRQRGVPGCTIEAALVAGADMLVGVAAVENTSWSTMLHLTLRGTRRRDCPAAAEAVQQMRNRQLLRMPVKDPVAVSDAD